MIFHSVDFFVFFLVVVAIYWRLPHRGQNLLLLGASYFFYGWVHPWFVILMLASTTVDYWAGQRMEDDPARKKAYLYASLAVNLGMLGRLQVLQLLHREHARGAGRLRADGVAADPGARAAGRHLVLHLPGAELHGGGVLGTHARAAQRRGLRTVRRVLPAPGSRADHARHQPAGAGRAAAHLERGSRAQRAGADRLGFLQEAGGRRQRRHHRQPRVQPRGSVVRDAVGGRVRLRPADLRGLLGLLGHRAGHGTVARVRAGAELQPPLHLAQPHGLLAPLAHFPVELVPGLRLHPAGRQPGRRPAARGQPDGHVPGFGPVARRQLELRALGPLSWDTGGCHAEHREAAEAAREMARSAGHRPDSPDRIGGVRGLVVLQGNQPGLPAPVAGALSGREHGDGTSGGRLSVRPGGDLGVAAVRGRPVDAGTGTGLAPRSFGRVCTGRPSGPPVSAARCCKPPRQESWSR